MDVRILHRDEMEVDTKHPGSWRSVFSKCLIGNKSELTIEHKMEAQILSNCLSSVSDAAVCNNMHRFDRNKGFFYFTLSLTDGGHPSFTFPRDAIISTSTRTETNDAPAVWQDVRLFLSTYYTCDTLSHFQLSRFYFKLSQLSRELCTSQRRLVNVRPCG